MPCAGGPGAPGSASSAGSQRGSRWQFCSSTHSPRAAPAFHGLGSARAHALAQRQVLQPHARPVAQRLACEA